MGITSAAPAKTATRKNKKSQPETTPLPPSPERTSAGDSDEEMSDDEVSIDPETPPSTQEKSKEKAQAAKPDTKPVSTIPAKRVNDDLQGAKTEPPAKKIASMKDTNAKEKPPTKKGSPTKDSNTKAETPKTSLHPVSPAPSTDPVYVLPHSLSPLVPAMLTTVCT